MAATMVEAIFVIFYGTATHKATYGRDVEDDTYTKDYIQLSKTATSERCLRNSSPGNSPGTSRQGSSTGGPAIQHRVLSSSVPRTVRTWRGQRRVVHPPRGR